MNAKFYKYAIGTRIRPTKFLTSDGELSEKAEDAALFDTYSDADKEIKNCDEPDAFTPYITEISICSI